MLPDGPASNNYEGGFGSALMAKDLAIANQTAKKSKIKNKLGNICYNDYLKLLAEGKGNKDFGIIYEKLIEENKKSK